MIIFYLGLIGGGDVKLNAALMLVIPTNLILLYFFTVSFIGALLALSILVYAKISKNHHIKKSGVPYGVAIIFGFLIVILFK